MVRPTAFLTDAQLRSEIDRCAYCETKPCRDACPCDCSPADFIIAARGFQPSDFRRAAAMIMAANPLGGVCGVVCPDTHCMAACARSGIDRPIEIPAIQAAIVERARLLGVMPDPPAPAAAGTRVAVVGAGPAGMGAAAVLARNGCTVDVFDAARRPGGMATLIPSFRLDPRVLAADLDWVARLGAVRILSGRELGDPAALLGEGYAGVVAATGLGRPITLGIPGEERAVPWTRYLRDPLAHPVKGQSVAVVGGGAVAVDCAVTARRHGAVAVELFTLEALPELPLTAAERELVRAAGVALSGRCRVVAVRTAGDTVTGISTRAVSLAPGTRFHPGAVKDVPGTDRLRDDIDAVIVAIGGRSGTEATESGAVVRAGDLEHGASTVVEAVAAGKNAALRLLATLRGGPPPDRPGDTHGSAVKAVATSVGDGGKAAAGPPAQAATRRIKSTAILPGCAALPVSLECDFFGTPLRSPLLLSAAPPTDGCEPVRRAYEAGWAGAVLKTAFDGVPIHVPARYMCSFAPDTYGNCDNVSAHGLDRVCREVERLRAEFPDRLTLASTGGPVTGDDARDAAAWQSNTRKLEAAGAQGIEYSLSCPQGGDGTKGDIVSQDADLTATIIGWVLAAGDPAVPKLFKLTPAVTSIHPIAVAVKRAFARFPRARAGVTLANTFPTLAFRPGAGTWDEGVVVGMSGAGVAPITMLTLANVARWGLVVSANGGATDYRALADMLALGARTVQVCSVVMRHGVGILRELESGLSHLLEARRLASVADLVGRALPDAITPFGELTADKPLSTVDADLCVHCGNCTRCPYLAIGLDESGVPHTDPARCVGCSFCAQRCISGALSMRERTDGERAALVEH